MAIPVLKLNLAPPPTLWRRQHALLSWSMLGLGALALALAASLTWRAYRQADQMGRNAFLLSRQTQEALARQGSIQAQLRSINVPKELPRWKLAERILAERSIPWSRLTAELERSLVQDVRIRTLQRSRGSDQQVAAKLKGEARSREAEAAFVESIQKNPFFSQVILERESERQGGGVEFEYTLPVVAMPPPYAPLPKFGAPRTQVAAKAVQPKPGKPIASKPVPTVAPAKPLPVLEPPTTAVSPPPVSAPPEPSPESVSPRPRALRERRPRSQEQGENRRRPRTPEVRP
jgi:hypothetical protein